MNSSRVHRVDTWLLLLGALNLYLLNAPNLVFMDPDEARYVMIAREMLTTGDWLVPHQPLRAGPYFDKPILYFWMLAGTFRTLGISEFAARLLSAVGGALVVAATFRLGRMILSTRAALAAALMLGTCVLMLVGGRFVRMDIWLTAFVAWGIVFWARVHFESAPRRNLLYGYLCLAAACLTKGLVGLLLPFAAIGIHLVWRRDWAAIRRARVVPGLLIIVLLAGPWYAYMAWRFPGYLSEFFWKHHFLRASTTTFGRSETVLFLPGAALAGFLPWTFLLLAGIYRALPLRRNADWPQAPGAGLIHAWAGIGILPFAFFQTQLPVYIMPAFPALALIAGGFLDQLLERGRRSEWRLALVTTGAIMALALVALAVINRQTFCESPWSILARRLGVFAAAMGLALYFFRRNRIRAVLTTLAVAAAAVALEAAWVEGPGMFGRYSSHRFVRPLRERAAAADLLVIGPSPRYALPLYLDKPRHVELLDHVADFSACADYPNVTAVLMTDRGLYQRARAQLGRRMVLLDQRNDECLVRIAPPLVAVVSASEGAAPAEQPVLARTVYSGAR